MHETVQIKRLRALAARRGWSWLGEPASGFCGRLQAGRRTWFVIGADLGVNSSSAARLARDKAFAQFYLAQAGLPTIPTCVLHAPADAETLADFPVLLKPNDGRGGAGISVAHHPCEVAAAYAHARSVSRLVLAQPLIQEREFRVVVFNRRPLLAYEKKPMALAGDGAATIRELLPPAQQEDRRLLSRLREHDLTLDSILAAGRTLTPWPLANLKRGGTWRECLSELSPALLTACVTAADSLGLVMAGVDLFAGAPEAGALVVNEVNPSPGLQCIAEEAAMLDPLFAEIERYIISHANAD